uniref:CSON005683 protein n=1 Tax=Culicoides sonorensis TaxID=179676 RepID=A0A336LV72_CULSO
MSKSGFDGYLPFWKITRLQFFTILVRYWTLPWIPVMGRRFRHRKFIPPIEDQILLISATDLAEMIRKQEITSEYVVKVYINRIKAVNPVINALCDDRFDDALNDAKAADELCIQSKPEFLQKKYPLLGVPFTVKVTIEVQGLNTHAGVVSRKNIISERDAEAVEYLRKAGAIPLCMSNAPEWAMSFETHNKIIGHTLNPYDTRRSPGGSSGGDSALIASAASLFGIGSDFMGSCRLPAMFCGIFGHRPTTPLVSIKGCVPEIDNELVNTIVTFGPLCRYAKDLPVIFKAMIGPNTKLIDLDTPVDMKSIKVYYPISYGKKSLEMISFDKEILHYIQLVVDALSQNGALCEILKIPFYRLNEKVSSKFMDIPTRVLTHFSEIPPGPNRPILKEYWKWCRGKPDHCINSIHVEWSIRTYKDHIKPEARIQYKKSLAEFENELKVLLDGSSILILPTFPTAAYHHYTTPIISPSILYLLIPSILNLPATSVPLGLNKKGLPIGIQIIAGQFQDRLCFAVAQFLEEKFGGWIQPPNE